MYMLDSQCSSQVTINIYLYKCSYSAQTYNLCSSSLKVLCTSNGRSRSDHYDWPKRGDRRAGADEHYTILWRPLWSHRVNFWVHYVGTVCIFLKEYLLRQAKDEDIPSRRHQRHDGGQGGAGSRLAEVQGGDGTNAGGLECWTTPDCRIHHE